MPMSERCVSHRTGGEARSAVGEVKPSRISWPRHGSCFHSAAEVTGPKDARATPPQLDHPNPATLTYGIDKRMWNEWGVVLGGRMCVSSSPRLTFNKASGKQ